MDHFDVLDLQQVKPLARTMIPTRPLMFFIILGEERKAIWPEERVCVPGFAAQDGMDIVRSMVFLYENILLRVTKFSNRLI
jgi:hypothetical protein